MVGRALPNTRAARPTTPMRPLAIGPAPAPQPPDREGSWAGGGRGRESDDDDDNKIKDGHERGSDALSPSPWWDRRDITFCQKRSLVSSTPSCENRPSSDLACSRVVQRTVSRRAAGDVVTVGGVRRRHRSRGPPSPAAAAGESARGGGGKFAVGSRAGGNVSGGFTPPGALRALRSFPVVGLGCRSRDTSQLPRVLPSAVPSPETLGHLASAALTGTARWLSARPWVAPQRGLDPCQTE